MKELRIAAVVCMLGLSACGAEETAETEALEETVSAEAEEATAVEAAPEVETADIATEDIAAEDFPVAEDFADEASAAITAQTLEQELAALEAEIGNE